MNDYLFRWGGGEGPDVWACEKVVSAVDIEDAYRQADALSDQEGGTVIGIFPPPKPK